MTTPTTNTTDPSSFFPTIPELCEQRVDHWNDMAMPEPSLSELAQLGTHSPSELEALKKLGDELLGLCVEHGALEGLSLFFLAAESYEDALDRLAVMHTAEVLAGRRRRSGQPKHLGLDPAPFPGWVNPGDRHRLKRILRPLELALIRLASLKRSPQHTAVAAFGEAGAVSGELPLITAKLLEFPPGTILLPGGVDGLHLRAATIPQWSAHFVETMVALRPNAPVLVYGGRSTDPRVVLAATGMAATTLLRDAGLGGDKSASYYSLRYTIGRQILESAGTDAAVEFLGEGNYDLVRQKLGLTPADPPRRRH